MNKILAIVLFPVLWASMYLYRIIWFDIIGTIIQILCNLLISPLSSLWLVITFPIVLIWEIPVGLVISFFVSIETSRDIFIDEIDIADAFKSCFAKKQ